MQIELFDIGDDVRLKEALAVRFVVFVDEQRVPAEEEIDEHDRSDRDACHVLVREGAEVVGAGRYFRRDQSVAQIGRMAVLGAHRSRGIGRQLLDALVDDARRRGFDRASLNAQDHAVGFYAKAGFIPSGATFYECAILHQPMELAL